jgi:hypothetical protein
MESYKPLVPARPLPDQRLLNRLDTLLDCFSARPDCTIPEATGDRNAMDTAYDFF